MSELASCHCISGIVEIADRYDAVLLDQWGVIHNGNQLYPGVKDVLQRLRKMGKKIVIVTNSSKTSEVNRSRLLSRFGLTPTTEGLDERQVGPPLERFWKKGSSS